MNMKKLASLLLALVMMLSVCSGAMAAIEGELPNGSITINDAVKDQTYRLYQILYLESVDESFTHFAYKANSAWAEWLKDEAGAYVAIDDLGYVTWVEGADVKAFSELAQKHAATLADADMKIKAESETVEFLNLKLGYYLIDTTLGTLCSLDTTTPNVIMEEKNQAPTVTKEVQEDSTGTWGKSNDASVGDTVNFKATITVQAGAENYVLHDTMSAGLTYTGVTSVKIGTTDVDKENYTVSTGCDDGCTFEVAFKDEYIATLAADTEIVIEYTAILNDQAVVGLPGNPNSVKLEYGDEKEPSYTPDDKTTTYTWDLDVVKYTKNGETEVVLAGATFQLCNDPSGQSIIKLHKTGENEYEVCALGETCTAEHVTEITTDANGRFKITGLDAGTYYLHETAAPAGYNKLAGPVQVIITGATENEETKELEYKTVEAKVENKTGSELPSTGGMGTTILYAAGGILLVGALVLMLTKKRANAK